MGLFSRLLRPKEKLQPQPADASEHSLVSMLWRADASMPIPDWEAIATSAPPETDTDASQKYWSDAALHWLNALHDHLGHAYSISTSEHFAMLAAVDPTTSRLALEACERTRKRILKALPGIAKDSGYGPIVVLIFDTADAYYAYIGNYYPEEGEFAQSSGMFLQNGYGHFVFVSEDMARMEPVIAHELTHSLVSHLPLPAWLNEGTAMGMEKRLNPELAHPRYALYSQNEMTEKHAKFWNEATIQEFWSGKSFLQSGEGPSLSYDLGENLTRLVSRDYETFVAFANAATYEDAGARAAHEKLGIELEACAAAVLGPGLWRPEPSRWREGVERGQF